jgi:hypothetical protein
MFHTPFEYGHILYYVIPHRHEKHPTHPAALHNNNNIKKKTKNKNKREDKRAISIYIFYATSSSSSCDDIIFVLCFIFFFIFFLRVDGGTTEGGLGLPTRVKSSSVVNKPSPPKEKSEDKITCVVMV